MADNQKERKNRQRLIERYKSKQPDRDWDDENGSEDLAGLAADELARMDEDNKKLSDLYAKDSRFAGLMNHVIGGGAMEDYLLDHYGSELRDILDSEDGKTKLAERRKKEDEDAARRKKDDDEYDANGPESEKAFNSIKEKYNLSDEELGEIYGSLKKISRDVAYNKYDVDVLERYIKGGKYDTDVASAREEGHIAGKNARARRDFRESGRKAGEMPTPEGTGAIARESKATKKAAKGMFGITITSSGDGGGSAAASSGGAAGGE
jgi:hypothetical protein